MPEEIPQICVERGEGYWCYHTHTPPEPQIAMAEEPGVADQPTFNEQLVYRPVKVGVNDKGEVYAYYYDADMSFDEMLETDGKRFVPTQQVYAEPLPNAEPAYKHESKTPT